MTPQLPNHKAPTPNASSPLCPKSLKDSPGQRSVATYRGPQKEPAQPPVLPTCSTSTRYQWRIIPHLHPWHLAHASPRRMHTALTNHPELNTSLKPSDTQLFTHCDACKIANIQRPAKPEKADVRATAIGYRLHLDTSGTVRPATAFRFTRVLAAVDDPSRWNFVTLLRNATMDITAAAMRAILRKVAGDESVLRTKVIRHRVLQPTR